jgi:hypothetical protein
MMRGRAIGYFVACLPSGEGLTVGPTEYQRSITACLQSCPSVAVSDSAHGRPDVPRRRGAFVLSRSHFGFELILDVSRFDFQRCLWLRGEGIRGGAEGYYGACGTGHVVHRRGWRGHRLRHANAQTAAPSSCKILRFEPERDNLVELKRNIAVNGAANVEVSRARQE